MFAGAAEKEDTLLKKAMGEYTVSLEGLFSELDLTKGPAPLMEGGNKCDVGLVPGKLLLAAVGVGLPESGKFDSATISALKSLEVMLGLGFKENASGSGDNAYCLFEVPRDSPLDTAVLDSLASKLGLVYVLSAATSQGSQFVLCRKVAPSAARKNFPRLTAMEFSAAEGVVDDGTVTVLPQSDHSATIEEDVAFVLLSDDCFDTQNISELSTFLLQICGQKSSSEDTGKEGMVTGEEPSWDSRDYSKVFLFSRNYGFAGFLRCLQREPQFEKIRGVQIVSDNTTSIPKYQSARSLMFNCGKLSATLLALDSRLCVMNAESGCVGAEVGVEIGEGSQYPALFGRFLVFPQVSTEFVITQWCCVYNPSLLLCVLTFFKLSPSGPRVACIIPLLSCLTDRCPHTASQTHSCVLHTQLQYTHKTYRTRPKRPKGSGTFCAVQYPQYPWVKYPAQVRTVSCLSAAGKSGDLPMEGEPARSGDDREKEKFVELGK